MTATQRRLATLLVGTVLLVVGTASQSRTTALFRADQAADGQARYRDSCAACHGTDLSGTANAPPLAGMDFLNAWANRSTQDLLEYMRSARPPAGPGNLGDRAYDDIAAYILQSNGAVAGAQRFAASASVTFGSLQLGAVSTRAADQPERPAAAAPRA